MDHNRVLQQIRSVIFGMEDGLVSMWGLVIGVSVGSQSSASVILAGLAGAIPAALSMAAGEYLSSKSKREMQDAAIVTIEQQVKKNKKAALKRLARHYIKEGFTQKQVGLLIRLIRRNAKKIVQQLIESEGHVEETLEHPAKNAALMFTSFLLASLFPILPFMMFELSLAQQVSFVLTAVMLFVIGASKTKVTKKQWWKSGFEMLLIGGLAGVSGYLIGNAFS